MLSRAGAASASVFMLALSNLAVLGDDLKPAAVEFFEKQVRPLLVEHCYECHSTDGEQSGGLVLDSKAGWETGGESGPSIVAGKPDGSLLIEAVRYESVEMPPDKRLPDEKIEILVKWVAMGAPDPRDAAAAVPQGIDIEEGRKYWAFQQPNKADLPPVKNTAWPYSDTDRLVLAAQEAAGVRPVRDADRLSLLRRVTFDLIGLPPTVEEVNEFLDDPATTSSKHSTAQILRPSSGAAR